MESFQHVTAPEARYRCTLCVTSASEPIQDWQKCYPCQKFKKGFCHWIERIASRTPYYRGLRSWLPIVSGSRFCATIVCSHILLMEALSTCVERQPMADAHSACFDHLLMSTANVLSKLRAGSIWMLLPKELPDSCFSQEPADAELVCSLQKSLLMSSTLSFAGHHASVS